MSRLKESTSEDKVTYAGSGRTAAPKGSVALDQWRGMALILVLISHGFYFTGRVAGAGRIGVNLFFFISGILTFRSLNGGTGAFGQSTAHFLKRRLWRLYPALLAYTAVMAVATIPLQQLSHLPPQSDFRSYLAELPFALTYTVNYGGAHHYVPALEQLWSLSCEIQFYFLAPFIFALGRGNRRRSLLVFGSICLLLTLIGVLYPLRAKSFEHAKYHFEVAVWPMMFGFLCESRKDWFLRIPRPVVRYIFTIGVASILIALIIMPFSMHSKRLVIAVGALGLFPCLLGYLNELRIPGGVGRSFAWLGERTYSIYLWQQPFTICGYLPAMLHPLGAAASTLLGAFWFNICEQPFLSKSRVRQVPALQSFLRSADHHLNPQLFLRRSRQMSEQAEG
jgi:peptidoglycan/LPS O-acetylase OafA/YrhL